MGKRAENIEDIRQKREEELRRARKEGFEAAKITTRRDSDGASVPLYPEFINFESSRKKSR